MAAAGTGAREPGTTAGPRRPEADPRWVEAGPFRAHLRHLMSVGPLDAAEVAVVLGLSTRAVQHLLDGRDGRVRRRISPHTARRLLLVRPEDVRGLRWCLSPTAPARRARDRLRACGWSDGELAAATGFGLVELDELDRRTHGSRLLTVRLLGLARRLPLTLDDEEHLDATAAA